MDRRELKELLKAVRDGRSSVQDAVGRLSTAPVEDLGVARPLLVAWNAVGAAVLLSAPVLIQLSQPGPFQLYFQGPTTHEVLGFPMSIVPTLVAPLFVGLHLIALHRLLARPEAAPRLRPDHLR